MIELFEQDIRSEDRPSSKGNQLKWKNKDIWYKADYTGYEGFAEYVVSQLLKYSTLSKELWVDYKTEKIRYKNQEYLGCKSNDILGNEWMMITLERLFKNHYGESLHLSLYKIQDETKRLEYLVQQVQNITGLKEFGEYMSILLTIDTLFLNEDRHMHNIAVLKNESSDYRYCPIFDHGASLLADTMMDYPLTGDISEYLTEVQAKTFCMDFDLQIDIAEQLYGKNIHFCFTESNVREMIEKEEFYSQEVKQRVFQILLERKRKYQYLFI